jgi:hypothetical protein
MMIPAQQTDEVIAELRDAGIAAVRGGDIGGDEEILNIVSGQAPDLIQAALDAADYARAEAMVMGTSLAIQPRKRAWAVALRRADLKSDPDFLKLHRKLLSKSEVRELIPHADGLTWTDRLNSPPLNRAESSATDAPYRITLVYPADVDPAQVKIEFAEDLRW